MTILIIEDEGHIADLLKFNLDLEGYETITTDRGLEGLKIVQSRKIDLIIMDVMLPDSNGIDLCRKVKNIKSSIPILMLSALGQSHDRINGLKSGADDYLSKPFNLEELLLRVHKLINRFVDLRDTRPGINDIITIGQAKFDFNSLSLISKGQLYNLTAKEAELLKYLVEKKNMALNRHTILEEVWGYEQYPNTRTIDNFISTFRKYIEIDVNQPQYIKTIRGVGYILVI
jgi:two-component system, OmpR family, alkaline phosphatase synthesis response regulator PhoP